MPRYRGARLLVSVSTVLLLLFSMVVTVGAAPTKQDAPSITSSAGSTNIVPFGTSTVTISFTGGTNASGQQQPAFVCFAYNGGGGANPAPVLFAAGTGASSQTANFIQQSGTYTFLLYSGTPVGTTCPAASAAVSRLDLTKAGVFPGVGSGTTFQANTGTGLALVTPTQPVVGTAACPNPQGSANGGAFTGSPIAPPPAPGVGFSPSNPAGGTGQYVGYQTGNGGTVNVDGKDYLLGSTVTLPRTICVAFDAGYRTDNTQRPEVLVFVTVNNSTPSLLARGPFGLVRLDAVVSGSYRFTLYDVTSTGGTGAPITVASGNCTTINAGLSPGQGCDETVETAYGIKTTASSTTFTGGTAAIIPFVYDGGGLNTLAAPSNPAGGNPTLVCVSGGALPAGAGIVASYSNSGGLNTSISGLAPSATVYTLQMYTIAFAAGQPMAITAASGPCAAASITNSNGVNPAVFLMYPAGGVPAPYSTSSNGATTFTVSA